MNETPATVRMIDGATAPAISNVFVNNACASCTLQITGTFTAATVLVEGIVNVASNQWVTLAAFNLSDLSLEKDGADKAGIYQVGIEGILRVRMNVTEVSGGNITIAAQFGNATINQFSKTEASNLVPITAYDLAVAGGYTGTLEQFETDMGNSASNATAAANSADEAAQTLTDVQTAGTEAVDAVQAKGQEVLASIPEDYTELTGEVDDLKTQLSTVFDEKSVSALISSIAGFTKITDRSANVITSGAYIGIKLTNTSGYDTYYIVLDKDISLSFDTTNTAYIALCTGEDYTDTVTDGSNNIYLLSSSPVRYRKSSNDLPTTTPLAISAGDAIAITLTADGDDYISGITTGLELKGDTFVEKTASKITVKLRDVELTIEKITNVTINLNVWRITGCKIGTYTVWLNQDAESVIQLLNEDDFIGGYHGDEQQTSIKIYLDNEEITESQVIESREFSHLDILIESDLYHANGGTKCFERDTVLRFDKDGVKQYNTFKAMENVNIINWMVGMLSCENTDTVGDATGTPVLKTFFTNYEPFYHAIDTDIVQSKYNKNAVFVTTKGTLEMTADAEGFEVVGRVRKYTAQSREKAYFYGINNLNGEAITSGTILSSSNTLTFT